MSTEEGPVVAGLRTQIEELGYKTWWEREESFFGDVRWQLTAQSLDGRHHVGQQARVDYLERQQSENPDMLAREAVAAGWRVVLVAAQLRSGRLAA